MLILGKWNIASPQILKVAGKDNPISRMLCVNGNLWCSTKGTIRIVDIAHLTVNVHFIAFKTIKY